MKESWDANKCAWKLKEALGSGRFSKNDAAEVAAIEGAIDVLFKMVDGLYVGEEEAASHFTAAIQVLFNEGDAYKAEIATLKAEIAALKADNATLKSKVATLENALLLRQFAVSFIRGIIRMSFAEAWPTMSEDSREELLISCRLHHLQKFSYNEDTIYYADRSSFLKACAAYRYFCDEVKKRTGLTQGQFRVALEQMKGEGNVAAHPDLKDSDMARIPALIGQVCQCYSQKSQEKMHQAVNAAKFAEKSFFHWMASQ